MNSAIVLIAMSVVGVDYGWEDTANGEQEYIIQLEPELLDKLRDGEVVTSEVLPEVKGVRRFRIQVGTGALPRGNPTVNVADEIVPEGEPLNVPNPELDPEDDATSDAFPGGDAGGDVSLEIDANEPADDAFELEFDSTEEATQPGQDDAFQLPDPSTDTSLINPDETLAAHLGIENTPGIKGVYDGGDEIPVPETIAGLLRRTVSSTTVLVNKPSDDIDLGIPNLVTSEDFQIGAGESNNIDFTLPANMPGLTEVDDTEVVITEDLMDQGPVNEGVSVTPSTSTVSNAGHANGEDNVIASNALATQSELPVPSAGESEGDDTVKEVKASGAPMVSEGDNSRPWGTLIVLSLCLFGSLGANVYMAYMLAGIIRSRKLIAD